MKLGRPQIGLAGARRITHAEARLTRLPRNIILYTEQGTGLVTFWTKAKGGGLTRYIYQNDRARSCQNILDMFWTGR